MEAVQTIKAGDHVRTKFIKGYKEFSNKIGTVIREIDPQWLIVEFENPVFTAVRVYTTQIFCVDELEKIEEE